MPRSLSLADVAPTQDARAVSARELIALVATAVASAAWLAGALSSAQWLLVSALTTSLLALTRLDHATLTTAAVVDPPQDVAEPAPRPHQARQQTPPATDADTLDVGARWTAMIRAGASFTDAALWQDAGVPHDRVLRFIRAGISPADHATSGELRAAPDDMLDSLAGLRQHTADVNRRIVPPGPSA